MSSVTGLAAPLVLHVVRHCDVENPLGVIYGRLKGFGLSSLGRSQADQVAAELAPRPLAAIYSSPRLRAIQTARVIRRHHPNVPLRISRRIDEVRTSYEGLIQKDVPSSINMFDNPKEPTDETMADVYRRMIRFVHEIGQGQATGSIGPGEIVCVSHAASIGILRTGVEGLPFVVSSLRGERDPQKGSVTTFVFPVHGPASIYYRALGAGNGPAGLQLPPEVTLATPNRPELDRQPQPDSAPAGPVVGTANGHSQARI